jgi:translocation and assembly module TamA
VAALLALSACASAPARDEAAAPVVARLRFRGNDEVSAASLKKHIVTAETSWWPLARKQRFDPVAWEIDLERIVRFYRARGYFQARVVSSQISERSDGAVTIEVEIDEGRPTRVASVEVRGHAGLTPAERARVARKAPLERGDLFTEPAWQARKDEARGALRSLGHAEARVDGQALVDVDARTAALTLFLGPGPRYRFGEIQVTAPDGIDPRWIRDQVRVAIGRDQTFSDDALDEASKRILAMGVFSSARVVAGDPDRTRAVVPVIVETQRAPVHTLKLGAGLGIDQVRQELRAVAAWSDRNFAGGLRHLSFDAFAGWAFIPGFLTPRALDDPLVRNGFIYRASGLLEQPRFFGAATLRGRTLIESERTLEEAFDAVGGRAQTGVLWQPRAALRIYPSYELQGWYLNGPRQLIAQSAPIALGCDADPCFITLSFLEQSVTWDRRDRPLEPRVGYWLGLSLQQGGGPLGGDFVYVRALPEGRLYFSFGEDERYTLAARLRAGTLITASGDPDDSAAVNRFYSGGSGAMRGFGWRRLAPLLLVRDPDRSGDGAFHTLPIGGNGAVEGNLELRQRLSTHLVAAAFLDYGSVVRGPLGGTQLAHLQWAAGGGLRYRTPLGPLRVDVGVRLPFGRPPPLFDGAGRQITYERLPGGGTVPGVEKGEHVNRSCFGLGGNGRATYVRDGICAFHISIGEAF